MILKPAAVAALAVAMLAVLAPTSAATADDAARRATFGSITYALSCAICHGATGHGDGEMADKLAVPAADLTRIGRRHGGAFPAAYVTEVIAGGSSVTTHGGQMPAWGLIFLKDFEGNGGAAGSGAALVDRRIGDLVAFLESIQAAD